MKKLLLLFICLFGINFFSSAQIQTDTLTTWPYVCQADSFPVTLSGMFASGGIRLDSVLHTYRNDSLLLEYYYGMAMGPAVPTPFRLTLKFITPPPAHYTIYAKRFFNNSLIATATTHIGVCRGPAGVSEKEMAKTEFYPNPATGWLFLKKLPQNTTATICDLTDKTLIQWHLTTHQATLPLDNLPAGIYLLKLQSQHGILVKKFVKQ